MESEEINGANRFFGVSVNVKAMPQPRARVCTKGGRTWAYKSERVKDYEWFIANEVRLAMIDQGVEMIENVPIFMKVTVVKEPPKSFTKKQKEDALNGDLQFIGRPDVSNLYKLIEDALNDVLYKDDSQIVRMTCIKLYGERDEVVIQAFWFDQS